MKYLIECDCGRKTIKKRLPYTAICKCGRQLFWQTEQRKSAKISILSDSTKKKKYDFDSLF